MTIAKPFLIALLVFVPIILIDQILMWWLYKVGLKIKNNWPNIYDGFLGSQHTKRPFPYNHWNVTNSLLVGTVRDNSKRLEKAAVALKNQELEKKAIAIRFLANFFFFAWLLVLLLIWLFSATPF